MSPLLFSIRQVQKESVKLLFLRTCQFNPIAEKERITEQVNGLTLAEQLFDQSQSEPDKSDLKDKEASV